MNERVVTLLAMGWVIAVILFAFIGRLSRLPTCPECAPSGGDAYCQCRVTEDA